MGQDNKEGGQEEDNEEEGRIGMMRSMGGGDH